MLPIKLTLKRMVWIQKQRLSMTQQVRVGHPLPQHNPQQDTVICLLETPGEWLVLKFWTISIKMEEPFVAD